MGSEFDFEPVRQALARAIADKGIAPTTLSQKVGKSKSLVKEILEEGRDIKLSTLTRLAGALGIEVTDLLPRGRPATSAGTDDFNLPNEAVLTSTFAVLLDSLGIPPHEDARARKLAMSFPGALRAMIEIRAQFDDLPTAEGALSVEEVRPAA
jgi:DNA-binding Xre family transcriptional regulator